MLTRTYPPRIGGPGAFAHLLSRELEQAGFNITIITQQVGGAPKYEEKDGIKIHRTYCLSDTREFTFQNLGAGIFAFTKKILENKKHDIFHAHDISVAGFSGCLAKYFIDKPFFLKYGGDLVFEYLSMKKPNNWDPRKGWEGTLEYTTGYAFVLHRIQNWYFRSYDMVLPDSEYGESFLLKRGVPANKVRFMPNGVDTTRFHPRNTEELKEKYGFNGKVIFTAARLVEFKAIDVLINAIKTILESEKTTLVIAGSGPEEEKLKRFSKQLGIEKCVRFVGNISRENMPEYLGMCDIFALPSYMETTPNALIEAMASGKPSVVSDVNGIREVVGDNCALKAQPGDSADFAEKILLLLNDKKLYDSLSKNALSKIKDKYTIEKSIERYINLYENIEI